MHPAFLDNMSWEMAEVYGAITDQILINLARHFPFYVAGETVPKSAFVYQAQMLAQMGQVNAETIRIIRNGLSDADLALKGVLEQSVIDAVRTAEPELLNGVKRGVFNLPVSIPVSPNQMRAFQLYYQQAAEKLNLVNTVMLESTQSAYRQTVADVVSQIELADRMNRTQMALDVATGETVTGVSSWNAALKHATDRLKDGGIVGFVDHAGHQWSAESYVAMDIRTTVFNTGRASTWEVNQDFGNDLYLVSWHNGARPLCYPWQNKVISANNRSGVTYDLDGNEITIIPQSATSYGEAAGLFGINCKHYPTPFIPGVSVADGTPQDPEENARTYEQSQEQRRLERKLREEKRDLLMAKEQGAPQEELDRLREKCRNSSKDIDEFCKSTGRTRHRDREAVYTKRDFPDKERYDVSKFEKDQQNLIKDYYQNGGAQQGYKFGEMTPKEPIVPQTAPTAPTAPQNLTIATAKTKEELYTAIQNEYGVQITDGVKNLDYKLVQEAMVGVQNVTTDFPEIGNNLLELDIDKGGIMSCAGERITFNPGYYTTPGKLQKSIDDCVASGWWTKGTTGASIGEHEAAHGIEWFLDTHNPAYTYRWEQIEAWNKCTEANTIVSQACKNIKKTPYGKGKVNAELIKSISGYSTRTRSETLAEAFADFYTNGENANPLSKEIVRLTTERYKAFGGVGNGR